MWHGSRVGGPTGPAAGFVNEEGEALWDGAKHYFRQTGDSAWGDPVPLVAVARGAIAYGSPWWLLYALCAVHDDAEVVGRDVVRGAASEHLRASVDVAAVAACSPEPLSFPRSPAEAFP